MTDAPPKRTPEEWDRLYVERNVESMPWFYPDLDPDLDASLTRLRIRGGSALDLGTGPATQALALAERGFDVVGTDISKAAVERANHMARERGLSAVFIEDDIRATKLTGPFDIVFDRGCLHVLPQEMWPRYARTVAKLTAVDGWLFLKCFSAREPRETVPHRFTPAEIRAALDEQFAVHSIVETEYQGAKSPTPEALFCVFRKRVAG